MTDYEKYSKTALDIGFSNAVILNELKLSCDPALRALCSPQACPNHGHNWVCPPGCGSLDECAANLRKFSHGLLLQSVSDTPGTSNGTDMNTYQTLNREHNLRLRKLLDKLGTDFSDILPLTSGGCIFCEKCAYPEACRNPQKRMQSLSAYGINVGELCKTAGLDFEFRKDKVFFVACVLF